MRQHREARFPVTPGAGQRPSKNLGVNDPDEAADGPGDRDILNGLVLVGEPNEDPVIEATRRIGRLIEIIDGVAAATEFDRRAKKAATEIAEVGKLTVQQGHSGDDAVNDWTAAMMSLYRRITGKKPATSVGAPEQPNEGIAAGPLIRFLMAPGNPLGIEFYEDAWRSRVRTVLRGASQNYNNNDLAIVTGYADPNIGSICANANRHSVTPADVRRPMIGIALERSGSPATSVLAVAASPAGTGQRLRATKMVSLAT